MFPPWKQTPKYDGTAMLNLHKLQLAMGGQAILRGVSFDLAQGELVCLLGPSGCGKTTALRAIAGLEQTDGGSIVINGGLVSGDGVFVTPQQRGIGLLFQDFALFPHLTVARNIAFGLTAKHPSVIKTRTDEMLTQMRLSEHAEKYPHMLSGGQQQRVALARALAPEPRLLLLDEPFSGLDTRLRQQIRNETREILKATGVTTLMVTHDWEEAMLSADRIALMRDGAIVQFATPGELYTNPADSFVAEFFGDVNRLDGTVAGKWVETRLGRVENIGLPNGTPVEVLIRPEAIRIGHVSEHSSQATSARVCSVQFSGANSLVQFGIDEDKTHLQAKLSGHQKMAVGDYLPIDLDRDQIFIFPKEG